ncbi:Protein RRNAD1 [Nymphon striatum]|nr:Protein RRNAD1 [Nymphon striatum]
MDEKESHKAKGQELDLKIASKMSTIVCNEKTEKTIKKYVSLASKFLSEYSWLTDACILEFFTDFHWEKLPVSWRSYYSDIDMTDLSVWLESSLPSKAAVMPLSLITFKKCSEIFSVQRKPLKNINPLSDYFKSQQKDQFQHDISFSDNSKGNTSWLSAEKELTSYKKQNELLNPIFRRHVKPKKQHEIVRLSEITSLLSKLFHCNKVVDIGSGQGHLSRLLSFGYDLEVLTMEAEGSHTSHAEKFDNQMVNKTFDSSNPENVPPSLKTFTMIGLHTCGNLASTIIKLFNSCEHCSSLISLPCCYMKMYDYKVEPEKLKIHCYRATLEVLIRESNPELKRLGLRSVKYRENLSFKEYTVKTLHQKNVPVSEDLLLYSDTERYLNQWKKLVVFYTLRLMLAPVVETIILFDRLIFLYEQGVVGCLAPIFDPVLSPRNIAIIAVKPKS